MYEAPGHSESQRAVLDELYRSELLEAVASLRDEVRSMETRMRDVQAQQPPKRRVRVERDMRRRSRAPNMISDAQRVKQDVEELVRRYETARGAPADPRYGRRASADPVRHESEGSWLKRMMMMMLIAEMQ